MPALPQQALFSQHLHTLHAYCIQQADVINRGFGGYNSRWGTFLVDDIINSFGAGRIKLVTICFGANDAVMPDAYL